MDARKRKFYENTTNDAISKKNKFGDFHMQYNPHFNNQKTININQPQNNSEKDIKNLKKNYKKLSLENVQLSNEVEQLKYNITHLEEMFIALHSEMLDMHRQYYYETTPIDPDNCSYLS